jgi:glyoxylase-like metal-dependent hydrolase (beta-lactamase superfamily II)
MLIPAGREGDCARRLGQNAAPLACPDAAAMEDLMRIGTLEILPVIDSEMRVPAARVFRDRTAADWEPHRDLLENGESVVMTMGGFLVRGDGMVALVDLGIGGYQMMGQQFDGRFMQSLAQHGVAPGDVTDVLFSHLHLDHVGWASAGGRPVFPNATYRCDSRDWEFWIETPLEDLPASFGEQFLLDQVDAVGGIADRFEMWSSEGAVLPGVNLVHAPGHTPGSTVMVLSSGDERAVLLGDAAHCPIELLEDEWGGIGDVDPGLALRTRVALAREYEGQDVPISAAHFPGLQFGRLLSGEGRRYWSV